MPERTHTLPSGIKYRHHKEPWGNNCTIDVLENSTKGPAVNDILTFGDVQRIVKKHFRGIDPCTLRITWYQYGIEIVAPEK